jgi:hypothetical protein
MHTCDCMRKYYCETCYINDSFSKYKDDKGLIKLFCNNCNPFTKNIDIHDKDEILKFLLDKYIKKSLKEIRNEYWESVDPKISSCAQCKYKCKYLRYRRKNNIVGYCCKCSDDNLVYCDTCRHTVSDILNECTSLNKDIATCIVTWL